MTAFLRVLLGSQVQQRVQGVHICAREPGVERTARDGSGTGPWARRCRRRLLWWSRRRPCSRNPRRLRRSRRQEAPLWNCQGCVGHVRPTHPAPSSSSSRHRFFCSPPSSHRAFIPASTSRQGAPASAGSPPAPCHPNPSVHLAKNILLLLFLLPLVLDHQAQGGGLLLFFDNRGGDGGDYTLLHLPPLLDHPILIYSNITID